MRRLLLLAAVVLVAAGCSPAVTPAASPASPTARTSRVSPSRSVSSRVPRLGDYDAKRDSEADIKAALAAAAKDKRNVLIDFGADWCLDCRVLTKLSTTTKVAPLLRDRYHVVSVDVGEFDHNLDVARNYDVDLRTSGIPALVVLDPAGKVKVTTNDGSFANARSMNAGQVARFLGRWSPA
jgi:thiol:disulfide interchange protein